jgi:uncharacterized membrane protein YgcG
MGSKELGKLSIGRHLAVGVFGLGSAGLAGTGLIGSGHYEHFAAKEIVVTPTESGGLRIREVVDYDMARTQRHGYFRNVDNDFGVPVEVTASSPDAPADLDVSPLGSQTRIRLGNANTTVSGLHRYVLSYTLPEPKITDEGLGVDVIGTADTMGTDRVTVFVMGMELDDPKCSVGNDGDSGGCKLDKITGGYRAVVEDLEPGRGITVGGKPRKMQAVTLSSAPASPASTKENHLPLALGMGAVNTGLASLLFAGARRRGRNEVYAGSAADAAFGNSERATKLVSDAEMSSLATTEFAPPKEIQPWEGAVLLSEHITSDSPKLWISGMVGREVMEVEKDGSHLILRKGEKFSAASAEEQALIQNLVGPTGEIETGKYNSAFASAWAQIRREQQSRVDSSGWWRNGSPKAAGGAAFAFIFIGGFIALKIFKGSGTQGSNISLQRIFASPVFVLIAGALLASLAAFAAYKSMLPSRSAEGSALAIRTESFRRFLEASEGEHVEWAWNNGLLREYSGWAVALGATGAWGKALSKANIPENSGSYTSPFLIHSMGSSLNSTHTAPSSSGSSGGGGGGGGSVGGGGGGGSSGGW